MKLLLSLLIISSLLSCSESGSVAMKKRVVEPEPKFSAPSPGTVRKVAVALNSYRDLIDLEGYEDLGSFHFRRLHFYTRKNPGIGIGPANVEEITAYFIDRYVVKIRYKLSEDVAGYLVDSLTTNTERVKELKRKWSQLRQIKWNYPNKIITYQNRCPDDDLALSLTKGTCDSPYWLYIELPGYKQKVRELKMVENAVREYLIDDPPHKSLPQ